MCGALLVTENSSSRGLNVLVVNWQDRENPMAGGAEIHLHEIFGRLAEWGDRVTLLCSGFQGAAQRADLDGIDVHRVGGRHSFPFLARRYFMRHLRSLQLDVVVEDLNKVPLFTPGWSPTPVVLLVHHLFGRTAFLEASLPVATATWLLERPIPRLYRGGPVVAVSNSTAEDLVGRGFSAGDIEIVTNGVDLELYCPDSEVDRFEEPTVVFVGRLKRYKRVDLAIRAMSVLRSRGSEARLLVVGAGDRRRPLEALVKRMALRGAVQFLGFVSEERKVELFRRSWVHVVTSPKEGWGIANLEAAACATPTVASDSPGLRDSVVDGETGYLVPHGDVPALVQRLGALLASPRDRDRMGESARRFAERFTWEGSARELRESLVRRVALAPSRG